MPSPTTTIQRRDLGEVVNEYVVGNADAYIGLQVMPIFQSSLQTGNYPVIAVEQMLKPRDVKRAPRGGYNRGDWGFEQGNFACVEYGWEEIIDDALARNYASYFDAEVVATKIATDVIMREQEKRIKTLVEAASAHSVTNEWDDATNATPRKDVQTGIQTIIQNTGIMPNLLVMTYSNFQNLLITDELLQATKYTGAITAMGFEAQKRLVAQYLGVDRVAITNVVENGNGEGQTFSASQVWSNEYSALVVTSGGSLNAAPCYGRSFLWVDDSPSNVNVESYREDAVRGSIVRARHYVDEKVLNSNCIYLLSNMVT